MFLRRLLVTNSSTTSHVYFGVALHYEEADRLFRILIEAAGREKLQEIGSIYDCAELVEDVFSEEPDAANLAIDDLIETMRDKGGRWEFSDTIEDLLGSWTDGIGFHGGGQYDEYTNVLYVGIDHVSEQHGDAVTLIQTDATAYRNLQGILEQIDARNRDIGMIHWGVSDY